MTLRRKRGGQAGAPPQFHSLPGGLFHHPLADLLRWNKEDHFEAFGAFDELVRRGCDPAFLLFKLAILAGAPRDDTWQGLTGFADPRSLGTALRRARVCADDLEKLLRGIIGQSQFQTPSDRAQPAALRNLVDRFESAARAFTPRTKVVSRTARALIVVHVKQKTGSYLDELVARILSPLLGPYDAVAQGQWRHDQAVFIAAARRT